jgi:hypothetical protein
MDKDFERIIDNLSLYKNSHPLLHSLWSNYLSIKKENFDQILLNCSDMIERLDTQPDLTQQQLLSLLILNNSYDLNRR